MLSASFCKTCSSNVMLSGSVSGVGSGVSSRFSCSASLASQAISCASLSLFFRRSTGPRDTPFVVSEWFHRAMKRDDGEALGVAVLYR
jgi:hypothetical protein